MNMKYISTFKPKRYIQYKPQYFKIFTFNAGFKKIKKDLLVLVFNKPMPISLVSTMSTTPAAPIIWNQSIKKNLCKVLIVNSGNANAFTGKQGILSINKYTKIASTLFRCNQNQVFVSSTGIIGKKLDYLKIIKNLKLLDNSKSQNIYEAAKAIMTTDTFPKVSSKIIKYKKFKIKIFGIAKGSGMISPKMGTMLAYIFIEAPLNKIQLNKILSHNIEDTFNSISVDGDTSTNDSVMIFSGVNKNDNLKIDNKIFNLISKTSKHLMHDLAMQIVSDGEGISKIIEVSVTKAKNQSQASKIAFSIANSILVKTAVFGQDANWGRVIMAIGKSFEKIKQRKIILKFDKLIVAKDGMQYRKIDIKKLDKIMKKKIIKINVELNLGKSNKTVWSSDLTHRYININADYST